MKQLNKNIKKLTPEYAYIIGVLLGDGNIQYDRIRFGVKDRKFIIKIKQNLKRWLKYPIYIKKIKNNKSYLYYIVFNSVYISKLTQEKIKKIKTLKDKKLIIAFLEGAYDSEGSVDINRLRIRFAVKDKQFINLITTSLEKLKINYKLTKDKNYFYWIRIYGTECIKFNNFIKFSIEKRKNNLKENIKRYYQKEKDNNKKINDTQKLKEKEWCKQYNLTRNQYYRHKRNQA